MLIYTVPKLSHFYICNIFGFCWQTFYRYNQKWSAHIWINKKVSCRKQIARQHSCHQKCWLGQGRPVKIFLTSIVITTQHLVAVIQPLCVRVGGSKLFGDAGAPHPQIYSCLTLETCSSSRVTVPNFVVLGQTVWL